MTDRSEHQAILYRSSCARYIPASCSRGPSRCLAGACRRTGTVQLGSSGSGGSGGGGGSSGGLAGTPLLGGRPASLGRCLATSSGWLLLQLPMDSLSHHQQIEHLRTDTHSQICHWSAGPRYRTQDPSSEYKPVGNWRRSADRNAMPTIRQAGS